MTLDINSLIESKEPLVECDIDVKQPNRKIDIDQLLTNMVNLGASDLHLKTPTGPVYRIDGNLDKSGSYPMTPLDLETIFNQIANDSQKATFCAQNEVDFAYSIPGVARYRVNVHRQRGTLSIVFRMIPFHVPTMYELGLPSICKDLVVKPRGLIIVTGPTGSGKSSTLAAMVNHLNKNCSRRIITIEDPIEYIYNDEKCVISQRELGADTESFAFALKHALRHDPDVIIVGEMRDLETMSTAVAAAETGHLVFGTLHTIDAAQTVDRLIDTFPSAQQMQVRLQFSQLLEAVISQTLLPKGTGKGRVAAFEVMLGSPAIRNHIREGKTHEINSTMMLSRGVGMQTMDQSLAALVNQGLIKRSEAMLKTSHPDVLTKLIDRPI